MGKNVLAKNGSILGKGNNLYAVEKSDAYPTTIVTASSYSNRITLNDIPAPPKAIMVRHRYGWQNRSNVVELLAYDELSADSKETDNCWVGYYSNIGKTITSTTRRLGVTLPYDYDAENKTLTIKADWFGYGSATFYGDYKVIIAY